MQTCYYKYFMTGIGFKKKFDFITSNSKFPIPNSFFPKSGLN